MQYKYKLWRVFSKIAEILRIFWDNIIISTNEIILYTFGLRRAKKQERKTKREWKTFSKDLNRNEEVEIVFDGIFCQAHTHRETLCKMKVYCIDGLKTSSQNLRCWWSFTFSFPYWYPMGERKKRQIYSIFRFIHDLMHMHNAHAIVIRFAWWIFQMPSKAHGLSLFDKNSVAFCHRTITIKLLKL